MFSIEYVLYRMCSLQNVFSTECVLYRMCSLSNVQTCEQCGAPLVGIECVLLLQNVFSYYRLCSLTTECVLLLQNVFSLYDTGFLPPGRGFAYESADDLLVIASGNDGVIPLDAIR
jgi:hypothetical protein